MYKKSLLKYCIITALLFFAVYSSADAQKFAIITDKASYEGAKAEILIYSETLQKEGLTNTIIIDKWNHPDSIREQLHNLYLKNKDFEGAVFIGDIPVPMLRDAQHMTSAFKMDQERYPWERSSVTSDRFYEDFDLKFNYLKRDTANKHLHYYSLRHDSPQNVTPDIYTGRIRIPWDEDFTLLKAFLKKAVAAHNETNMVDEVLFFAGHGYNSESMLARIDEKVTLLQQFPQLNKQQNGLEFIDFSYDDHIKFRLLSTLSGQDFDIALLHHHGDTDLELLDGEPPAIGVQNSVESIKFYLRSKVRDAKDKEAAKKNYMEWLGVPEAWFDLANDKAQTIKDSIYYADMDISASDLKKYFPGTRFIMFDACFNGSFQLDEYISGRYVFGNSRTIAAQANTVNSLQDKFPDEMAGLLALGMRIGELNKFNGFIETHIIGDPTLRFIPSGKLSFEAMKKAEGNNGKLLKLASFPHPDVQSWALRKLMENNFPGISSLMADKYFSSSYGTTRMECLIQLASKCDENFIKVLIAALDDSYELVRRFALIYVTESGDPGLIPALIKSAINPNISDREVFQLNSAFGFFDETALLAELDRSFNRIDTTGNYFGVIYNKVKKEVERECKSTEETIKAITSADTPVKTKIFEIKTLRNMPYHVGIPDLCSYALKCSDEQQMLLMLEAFGWFNYSYNKKEIERTCITIAGSGNYSEKIRNEALKTINRLNNPR
jgi:hypothetical protein